MSVDKDTRRYGVDADRFAEMFRSSPDEQLASALDGPYRDAVLGEIFRQMPSRLRGDRAREVTGALHWRIERPDGAEDLYEVLFDRGTCAVSRTETAAPRATMWIDGVSFLRLIAQGVTPAELIEAGKLRVDGDVKFGVESEHLFRKPLDEY